MDLIYTDANRTDIGVLLAYELDLAFGQDENDFECTVSSNNHCCTPGSYLYIEGTEYGGIVDAITRDTGSNEVTYTGRTWHGILESKIIQPDAGEDYLLMTGDANEVIAEIIGRLELGDLMTVADSVSDLTVDDYQMPLYVGGYTGIVDMLESVGGKLIVRFADGVVTLEAVPIHDYSQDDDFDSDLVDFTAIKSYASVNHLICLGKDDESSGRTIVHLYADATGEVSQTPTFTGMDEYAAVYENESIKDEEKLIENGTEKLKELFAKDELQIDFSGDSEAYDIGDIVGAIDNVTKIAVSAEIKKKIVTVKNGQVTVSYEVGGLNNG